MKADDVDGYREFDIPIKKYI